MILERRSSFDSHGCTARILKIQSQYNHTGFSLYEDGKQFRRNSSILNRDAKLSIVLHRLWTVFTEEISMYLR